MSSDNGIYILVTTDKFIHKVDDFGISYQENTFDKGVTAYRVTHAQAIDNFYWYKENEPHNLGYYLHQEWGQSKVFYSKPEAYEYAQELLKAWGYTEYGINMIDASEYNFPDS